MKEDKLENGMASEPAVALWREELQPVIPESVQYASIVNDVLQITPDLELEIAEAERGETVSMATFCSSLRKPLKIYHKQ